jgi:hypothetical protein
MALDIRFIRWVPIKQTRPVTLQITRQASIIREFDFRNAISWSYFRQGGLRPTYNHRCISGMMGSIVSTAKYSEFVIVFNDIY